MASSTPDVGSKVWIILKNGETFNAKVTATRPSSSEPSKLVYTLTSKGGEVLKSKLSNQPWGFQTGKKSKKLAKHASSSDREKSRYQNNGESFTASIPSSASALIPEGGSATVSRKRPRLPDSQDNEVQAATGPWRLCAEKSLPSHRLILAPMVGGSELAFRLLCRKYGADLCYTPMMSSVQFAADPEYRASAFQTVPEDRPLVAHFSANDPAVMLAAAKLIEHQVDAVDLNLGCPQRIAFSCDCKLLQAHAGHFGSYLLGKEDRPTVLAIVKTLANELTVPVFVKVRLLDTIEDSIELVEGLAGAGAALVAIHARYRVNLVGRSGPGARDGAAMLDQVAVIKKHLQKGPYAHMPIISNGNVRCWNDAVANLKETRADGIMSAEGILDDPSLYFDAAATRQQLLAATQTTETIERKRGKGGASPAGDTAKNGAGDENNNNDDDDQFVLSRLPLPETAAATVPTKKPSRLELAAEYLTICEKHPVKQSSVVFHTRRMVRDELAKYQAADDLMQCADLAAVQALVQKLMEYETSGTFVYDPDKATRAKEALERKKREEGKRKAYEERMVRKAKRQGLDPQHYLSAAALAPPTVDDLAQIRALGDATAQLAEWRPRFPQHCFAYHLGPRDRNTKNAGVGGCARDRTCAFLHCDPTGSNASKANESVPSWLEEKGM